MRNLMRIWGKSMTLRKRLNRYSSLIYAHSRNKCIFHFQKSITREPRRLKTSIFFCWKANKMKFLGKITLFVENLKQHPQKRTKISKFWFVFAGVVLSFPQTAPAKTNQNLKIFTVRIYFQKSITRER